MIERLVEWLVASGYGGIAALMFLENIIPPIPAEVIMPLAGFAARRGDLTLTGVIIAGTIGSTAGATAWYALGRLLGRRRVRAFLARHGRWLTLGPRDLGRTEVWFRRHGAAAVFLGRLVPTVRTLISLPAGLVTMPWGVFLAFTALGTLVWMVVLAGAGYLLADRYHDVADALDPLATGVFVALVSAYVYRVWTYRPDTPAERMPVDR